MVRFLVSILLGVAVTFGLFVFMAFLISGGAKRNAGDQEQVIIDIVSTPPKSNVQERKRVPPPPPPPPKTPPKPQAPEPDTSNNNAGLSFNVPGVELSGASAGMEGPGAGFGRDGEATPIVRIEPKYPIQAARDGKEGWVQLSFTINEVGGVDDVTVIAAEPKRIFDKEAKRALRKWKYKPKIVDGKPIKQPGMTVQLDFKMSQDGGAQ
ncbi:energy transducer TonB [Thalassotalea litorea]|uniref:Protein TonB n=1 Tax=Thalassotalea litorea TaxID=2020715 RepID=A0A5R9IH70_9GAMM|nr:energy transducer TonB [Thalassotalea litorea]TLU64865.1 energy transducer TonB [Thalassotalea litorea]